jgi:PAS domain S-box-containing protein
MLSRQLERCFGEGLAVPDEWARFLVTVDQAYEEADRDRALIERSLELTSQELIARLSELGKANESLRGKIAEEERAQVQLRASEARFRLLCEAAPIGVFVADLNGSATYSNPYLLRLQGLTLEQALGEGWRRAIHPDDRARVTAESASLQPDTRSECRFLTPDGVVRDVLVRVAPLGLENGRPTGFVGCIEDITERKSSEARIGLQYEIARIASEAMSAETVASSLIEVIARFHGWEASALWRVDPKTNVLRCFDAWHEPGIAIEEFEAQTRAITFERGIGLPGRVWASGKPAWIPNVAEDGNFPRAA